MTNSGVQVKKHTGRDTDRGAASLFEVIKQKQTRFHILYISLIADQLQRAVGHEIVSRFPDRKTFRA